MQWLAFLKKNRLQALALNDVIAELSAFLLPAVDAASTNTAFPARWQAGDPWSVADTG